MMPQARERALAILRGDEWLRGTQVLLQSPEWGVLNPDYFERLPNFGKAHMIVYEHGDAHDVDFFDSLKECVNSSLQCIKDREAGPALFVVSLACPKGLGIYAIEPSCDLYPAEHPRPAAGLDGRAKEVLKRACTFRHLHGWTWKHTGGGCMSISRMLKGDREICIANEDQNEGHLDCGLFDEDGSLIFQWRAPCDALSITGVMKVLEGLEGTLS